MKLHYFKWLYLLFTDHLFFCRNVNQIRDGIGEKVSHCLRTFFTFLSCFALSLYHGWEVTLMVIATIPIVLITQSVCTKIQTKLSNTEQTVYAKATNLFEEIMNGIRTVIAFCVEDKEVARYDKCLVPARKAASKKGLVTGFGEGMAKLISFVGTAGIYWYGLTFVLDDRDKIDKRYTPAVLTIVCNTTLNSSCEKKIIFLTFKKIFHRFL